MSTKLNPGLFDCYAKLEPNEPFFLLMGRDPLAGTLVRAWAGGCELRLQSHRERVGDDKVPAVYVAHEQAKISQARAAADQMEGWCRGLGKIPMRWSTQAPVITRAAPKTDITREQVDAVLNVLVSRSVKEMITELARAAGVPE
jgi:hypothetical protein